MFRLRGRTFSRIGKVERFADVLNDPEQPFDQVLEFFNDADRQRRIEESEIHHDRPALAGVVRELESLKSVDRFLGEQRLLTAPCLSQIQHRGGMAASLTSSFLAARSNRL